MNLLLEYLFMKNKSKKNREVKVEIPMVLEEDPNKKKNQMLLL